MKGDYHEVAEELVSQIHGNEPFAHLRWTFDGKSSYTNINVV
jgi:hypothetical protein